MKKKHDIRIQYAPGDILTWLNGRMTSNLIVRHKGKDYIVWSLQEAQDGGLTIEDSIAVFIKQHKINLMGEVT